MTQSKPLNLVRITDSFGNHHRAVAFAIGDGCTYWLSHQDAKIAAAWAPETSEERDMTRAAFIQKQAIKIVTAERAGAIGAATGHPFKIGDRVILKSGGHPMVVTGLRCSEGTCADPYAGQLEAVSVVWSQMSQLGGFDLRADELDPRILELADAPRPERCPF